MSVYVFFTNVYIGLISVVYNCRLKNLHCKMTTNFKVDIFERLTPIKSALLR